MNFATGKIQENSNYTPLGKNKSGSSFLLYMCNSGHPMLMTRQYLYQKTLLENSMEVSQKTKIEVPYDPAIPLLGIYLKENENTNSKGYMHHIFHSSIIYNSQDMEAN